MKKNTSQKAVGMPAQVSKFGENKPFTNRNVCFGSRNKKIYNIYIYVFVNGDHFVSILGEIQLTFVVLGYQLRLGFVGVLNVLGY